MKDPYWDDLGVAWTAIDPDPEALTPRLEARLRRQTVFWRAMVAAGFAASLLGLALGAWTTWAGWSFGVPSFIVRGVAIMLIAIMAGVASSALSVRSRGETGSLAEMLDLAARRAAGLMTAIRWGFGICLVAALFGLIGYVVRSSSGRPPVLSPIEPLAALGLVALVLFLVRMKTKSDLARYRHLERVLADGG